MTNPPYPPPKEQQDQPPPYYGHYPPPPPKRKLLGVGGIIAIISTSLLVLVLIAAGIYYFILRDKEHPRQTEESLGTQAPKTTTTLTKEVTVATEPYQPVISVFEQRLAELDAYEMQSLGSNPVAFYQHPTLDIAIDLRDDPEAARSMYVIPLANGFLITHRQTIALEYLSLRDYSGAMEIGGFSAHVELVSEEDKEAIEQEIESLRDEEHILSADFVPFQGGYLYIWDNADIGPDNYWYAKELYDSEVFFFASYVRDHLVESAWPGIEVDEPEKDADAEWQDVLRMLRNHPAEFEFRYSVPPYAENPDAFYDYNWRILEDIIAGPFYEHGTLDLNGDGIPEHIVHCSCYSTDASGNHGYWAVFTETTGGLKLIGFSTSGDSDLIYSDEHLYTFRALGKRGDFMFLVEEQALPVPAAEYRPVFLTEFRTLDMLMEYEEAGELDLYLDLWVVPKKLVSYGEGEYLEFFAADYNEFSGMMNTLNRAVSDGLIFRGRSPYDAGPGEVASRLQPPERLNDGWSLVNYLEFTYELFPWNDDEWLNATRVADLVADGTPITYEKAEQMLPYPSLLD